MARCHSLSVLRQSRSALLSLFVLSCIFLTGCGGSKSPNSGSGVVATITVSPSAPSVAVNATQQFTATAKDASGNTVTGVTFTWASSATNVATIDSSGLAAGVAGGTTQITAAASGVTSATDALTITAQVAACANDANLAGGYAMMLQGWTGINSVNRPGVFMGMVGSFHADGNGNITQGIADANASSDGPTSVTCTATYCLA